MITPCACLGPQCGEPYCPCEMEARKLERNPEWFQRNNPEQLEKLRAELAEKMKGIFK